MTRKGIRWAYGGMALGGFASVAANVLHAVLPAHPPTGSVVAAAFWPVGLFVTVEILAKVPWPSGVWWTVLRWGGTLPVAAVTAVVSYRHMSGLLSAWGEDPLTATIGPIAVDGLLLLSSGAIIAAGVLPHSVPSEAPVVLEVPPAPATELAPSPPPTNTEPVSVGTPPPSPPRQVEQASTGGIRKDSLAAEMARLPRTTVPDGELDRIIRATLATDSGAGYTTVTTAIKDAGYAVGNTGRVKDAIRAAKNPPPLRVVAAGE